MEQNNDHALIMHKYNFIAHFTENVFNFVNASFMVINGNLRTGQNWTDLNYSFSLHEKFSNSKFFWSITRKNSEWDTFHAVCTDNLAVTTTTTSNTTTTVTVTAVSTGNCPQIFVSIPKQTPTYLKQREIYWRLFLELRSAFLTFWVIFHSKLPYKKLDRFLTKIPANLPFDCRVSLFRFSNTWLWSNDFYFLKPHE